MQSGLNTLHASRFTAEAKASRHPFVYLPFGAGPRNCVGMRLAQLEMKMALVHLFRRFTVVACSETKVGTHNTQCVFQRHVSTEPVPGWK